MLRFYLFLLTFPLFIIFSSCSSKQKMITIPKVESLSFDHIKVSMTPLVDSESNGSFFIPYTGGNGASYNEGDSITSSGVLGLKAILKKGKLNEGQGFLTYNFYGIPMDTGRAFFNIEFGGKTGIMSFIIKPQPKSNASSPRISWGFFDDSGTPLSAYLNYDKRPSSTIFYISWPTNFPKDFCNNAEKNGMITDVTWQPDNVILQDILDGKYDDYLQKFGYDIASFDKLVMIRFAHEFNGDWYTWSYNDKADGLIPASLYVQTYKYVHDKVISAGGTNAYWIWSPNVGNGGKNPQSIESYYPGDDYVDVIGMDGYNWGTSQSWSSWQSFEDVFGSLYDQLTTSHPKVPIAVAEFACSSTGGNKADWITDMFNSFNLRFPRLKFFVWFNINKETDWRFTVNQEDIEAFKSGLQKDIIVYNPSIID